VKVVLPNQIIDVYSTFVIVVHGVLMVNNLRLGVFESFQQPSTITLVGISALPEVACKRN
jgi:hypothetical protein